MQYSDLTRYYKVESINAAAAFKSGIQRRLLLMCIAEAQSVKNLADQVGLPLNKVHYHIGRLVELGLLVNTHIKPRGGRSIKLYKAVAEGFYVSQIYLDNPTADVQKELQTALEKSRMKSEGGMLFHLDDNGYFKGEFIKDDGQDKSEAFQMWAKLSLDEEAVESFSIEAKALINKYRNLSKEPATKTQGNGSNNHLNKRHIINIALAPTVKNVSNQNSQRMRKMKQKQR